MTDMDIVRNRISQYCYFFDSHDLDGLVNLFETDATLKVNVIKDELKGRVAIRDWYRTMTQSALKKVEGGGEQFENKVYHCLFNHIIDLSDGNAVVLADYFSLSVARNAATNSEPIPTATPKFATCGRFRFWLRKTADDWRYSRLEIDIFSGEA
jgi:hypothetical protein